MQSFDTTSAVGGRAGTLFQDIYACGADGELPFKSLHLNLARPIKRITVSSGWILDGFAVTYNTTDGQTTTVEHGSQFSSPAVIDLNPNEILVSVFGRAGYQSYYKREFISNISFGFFDTVKGTARIVGPFGNSNGANEGKPFLCSEVVAFGGFAESKATEGLSGLFFHKGVGKRYE
ncbi:hypothetical protein OH76DRAFT_1360931 [Lentinus brumalis]|uniref:Jacalin-type lectin domain-containing protein n=1 Tax=Lentinus brumalis TaxID=2498619 RepID=A0A371CTR4_9APHY|nr:hypothetical protein OH76DRAFT_1360931 [Polyporus brumalis]